MHRPKFKIRLTSKSVTLFAFLLTASAAFSQAQPQLDKSYEVSLQVIVGSSDRSETGSLPSNLRGITAQLKNTFPFTNYRLGATFIGRVTNNGGIDYKSVSNILGQESDSETQTFLDWSMSGLRTVPAANGREGFQAQAFRFGARVPVKTGSVADSSGRSTPIINYEQIGLGIVRIGFTENTPTLIGTLSLPKTNGTLFLIATVRTVEL
ncbi:MAG: hypothetical protein ABI539_15405 [Acidobacteriota bacterium]